jgi:hypothetical protein
MRYGLIISAVLHAAAVLLAVLGVLPSPSPVVMTADPIPVDIVDIGELTNTRIEQREPTPPKPAAAAKPAPAKPPAPPPPPAAEAAPEPPPAPTPPKVPEPPTRVAEAAPVRQPEPPPPPKQPEPKPAPAAKPEPPKPEPKKPEPPKPEPKKAETKKPEPAKTEPKKPEPKKPEPAKTEPKKPEPKKPEPAKPDFQQMLKDLTKQPDSKAPAKEPAKPEPRNRQVAEAADEDSPSQSDAPRLSDRLTVSQMDALRRQMSACWLVDPGLPNVREVSVEIRVRIARDRTVESAEIVDTSRMRSDRTYRSVAESALRAVRNPRCNPLELPPDRYEVWRDAVFVFSPRDVL